MKRLLIILILVICSLTASAATYYVATTGDDGAAGSLAAPWLTWQKGFETIVAGDTLYIRGGTYASAGASVGADYRAVSVDNHDGTSGDLIVVLNYTGEIPILDCATMSADAPHYGIMLINCSYWYVKGLQVKNVPQHASGDWTQGIAVLYSTNITLERCVSHHNGGVGIGSAYGATDDILFLNCDSYANADPYTVSPGAYGNADGFGMEESAAGSTVTLTGCRSWNNSDDGYDCWDSDGQVTLDKCWTWHNGYRENQSTTGGDGNGFKLGRTDTADSTVFARTVVNCLSFLNRYTGYATNNAKCLIYFYHSTAYDNGYGGFLVSGFEWLPFVFKNLISAENLYNFNNAALDNVVTDSLSYHATWMPTGPAVTSADFVSVDSTGVSGARQIDGSLPILTYLHLASTSDCKDRGINNTGVSTDGDGNTRGYLPDLGAFEYVDDRHVINGSNYVINGEKLVIIKR